jgi:hypothetical protein
MTWGRIDSGPNWSNVEAAIRVLAGHLLDPVQLFVTLGVAGLLPGPGALKRDLVGAQQLPSCRSRSRPTLTTPTGLPAR